MPFYYFFIKFVFGCFRRAIICREEEFKDYAQGFVLGIVGDNVSGVPVAEEDLLSSFGYLCILP